MEQPQSISCKRAGDSSIPTVLPRKHHRGDGNQPAVIYSHRSTPDNAAAYDADACSSSGDDLESGSNYDLRDAKKAGCVTDQAQFYRSRTSVKPPALGPVCLVVDRGVIICCRCNFGIQRRNLRRHVFTTHPDLRQLLPSQEVIDTNLNNLEVLPALSEKIRPAMVDVPPLPFISVTVGWKCSSHGCVYAARALGTLMNHIYKVHKGVLSGALAKEAHVQMVYTSPKSCWAVKLDSALLVDDEPLHQTAVEKALQLLTEVDEDGTIHAPASDNHMIPFLADSGWAALCMGKPVKSLINMGRRALDNNDSDNNSNTMFSQVSVLVKEYFSVVVGEVKRFDYKAGCWINTPEGFVSPPHKKSSTDMHMNL